MFMQKGLLAASALVVIWTFYLFKISVPSDFQINYNKEKIHQGLGVVVHPQTIAWNKSKADFFFDTYLHYRQLGLTNEEIAEVVFNVRLPNREMGPHCYPFVCDYVFRAFADVVIDTVSIDSTNRIITRISRKRPKRVKRGDVVYVKSFLLRLFASKYLRRIREPFVLVTRDGDRTEPKNDSWSHEILDSPHLLKWFALNPNPVFGDHPKVEALPIGIHKDGKNLAHIEVTMAAGVRPVFNTPEYSPGQRPMLLFKNYGLHSGRGEITRMFSGVGEPYHKKLLWTSFNANVSTSKFVLSPRGHGIDCYRTYESILLQSIPIAQDLSPKLTEAVFKQAPVYILPWRGSDTEVPTQKELLQFAPNNTMGRSVTLAQYWFDKIDRVRNRTSQTTMLKPNAEWNKVKADLLIDNYVNDLVMDLPRKLVAPKKYLAQVHHSNCFPFICTGILGAYADHVLNHNHKGFQTPQERDMSNGSILFVNGSLDAPLAKQIASMSKTFILITTGNLSFKVIRSDFPGRRNLLRWFHVGESNGLEADSKLQFVPVGFNNASRLKILESALRDSKQILKGTLYNGQTNMNGRPILLLHSTSGNNGSLGYLSSFQGIVTFKTHATLKEFFMQVSQSKFVLCLSAACESTHLLEYLLLGAIPILDVSSRHLSSGIFEDSPVFVLPEDWRANPPGEQDLLDFEPRSGRGRAVVLAQFWIDKMDKVRGRKKIQEHS